MHELLFFMFTFQSTLTSSDSISTFDVSSFQTLGANTACRLHSETDSSGFHRIETGLSRGECLQHCANDADCTGVEFSVNRCEIWYDTPVREYTRSVPDFECILKIQSEENLCGFVPDSCTEHIDWTYSSGRYSNPEWYADFAEVTGIALIDASFNDIALYFYCKNTQYEYCNEAGLLPSCCDDSTPCPCYPFVPTHEPTVDPCLSVQCDVQCGDGWSAVLQDAECCPICVELGIGDFGIINSMTDEFDQQSLNLELWDIMHWDASWKNNEQQCYVPGGVMVADSHLILSSSGRLFTDPICNNQQFFSGAIQSKFYFLHGTMEIRVRLPSGDGLWPALWLLGYPSTRWPASGEIDIMEVHGQDPTSGGATLHFGPINGNSINFHVGASPEADLKIDFHVWRIVRTQDILVFYFDGVEFGRVTRAQILGTNYPYAYTVFDTPMVVQLNVAVGGVYTGLTASDIDMNTWDKPTMEIDYIRTWSATNVPSNVDPNFYCSSCDLADSCHCGTCGSFGGCSWSCDANDDRVIFQGFQQCINPGRMVDDAGCYVHGADFAECCQYSDGRDWISEPADCAFTTSGGCEAESYISNQEHLTKSRDCPAPNETPWNPLVLAHYMPWFSYGGSHWPPNSGMYYTPIVGEYDGSNANVLIWQLRLMQAAGIDGIIVDWYGTSGTEFQNTEAIWTIMKESFPSMKMSICYDFHQRVSDEATLFSDFDYMQETFFSHDQYVLHENGRPLLLIWPSDWSNVELQTEDSFVDLEERYGVTILTQFGNGDFTNSATRIGTFAWTPHGTDETEKWSRIHDAMSYEDRYFQREYNGVHTDMKIAGVFAGFSDHYVTGGKETTDPYNLWPEVRWNHDFMYLDLIWEKAREYRPPIVQLVTWNDYSEGTILEPFVPTEGCVDDCPTDPYGFLKQIHRLITGSTDPNLDSILREIKAECAVSSDCGRWAFCNFADGDVGFCDACARISDCMSDGLDSRSSSECASVCFPRSNYVSLGENTACRHHCPECWAGFESDQVVHTISDCEAICDGDSECTAMDYSHANGRCKIWRLAPNIEYTADSTASQCYLKDSTPQPDTGETTTATPASQTTNEPTETPSPDPSLGPTYDPSTKPSSLPSLIPTSNPTTYPSSNPTMTPTGSPSFNPSKVPTSMPTLNPLRPSNCPSMRPTKEPTSLPTSHPTMADETTSPTSGPTFSPSDFPSFEPSKGPTSMPTYNPTMTPTSFPSLHPSNGPTFKPTSNPTTQDETASPTSGPTHSPSMNPSASPTIEPTSMPSMGPTSEPSVNPTKEPSMNPTKEPSMISTKEPSMNPTNEPSLAPTCNPSTTPSLRPTTRPTANPTLMPSMNPSAKVVASLKMHGDYNVLIPSAEKKALFLTECSAALGATCVDVRPGSIIVDVEGTSEQVQSAQTTVEESGLTLISFPPLVALSESPTVAPTIAPADGTDASSTALSGGDDDDNMMLYIIIGGGAIVLLACLAFVMHACSGDEKAGGKALPDEIQVIELMNTKRTPASVPMGGHRSSDSFDGPAVPTNLERETSTRPPDGLTEDTGGTSLREDGDELVVYGASGTPY